MPLRKKYLPLPSPVVATYTTTDAIQQKGILEFYATSANWNDNTPPDGSSILVTSAVDPGFTDQTSTNKPRMTHMVNTTKTFISSPFIRPIITNGEANVVFTIAHTSTGSGTSTWTISIEKNGISLVSGSNLFTPGGISQVATMNKNLTIPRTTFKSGDTLGLSMGNTMTATARAALEHDPINRDVVGFTMGSNGDHPAITASKNPTRLTLFLPVEIKL